MIPNPSRRAASKTSESRRPVRAARTRTWRRSLSSMERVVFTFAIYAYCHIYGKAAIALRDFSRLRKRRHEALRTLPFRIGKGSE